MRLKPGYLPVSVAGNTSPYRVPLEAVFRLGEQDHQLWWRGRHLACQRAGGAVESPTDAALRRLGDPHNLPHTHDRPGPDIIGWANDAVISRSKSGDAEAKWRPNNSAGSTLCRAAIVMILSRVPWSVLTENHAIAVSHHDATLLTKWKLVHHLRGHNPSAQHSHAAAWDTAHANAAE
jgi:hypothetical protein